VNTDILPGVAFCGIFDGHGGDTISKMSATNFPMVIKQGLLDAPYDISAVIAQSFRTIDNLASLLQVPHIGSTVVYTLITPETIWFANAGDSICVVCFKNGTHKLMSQEHKVEHEKERIMATGGFVTYWDGVARVNGNLNVSRSVGDHNLKQWVISTPFVQSVTSEKNNISYILLASDGISDVLTPNQLDEIIKNNNSQDRQNLLESIVNLAKNMGSTDNITITLIDL
jgi:serine/threonine protein phosphatase PrpC